MNFYLYSNFTFQIQKPESVVKFDTVSVPALSRTYYWQRSHMRLFTSSVGSAIWDLTNEELNQVDDIVPKDEFGNIISLSHGAWELKNYFFLQRADDPGIFHYKPSDA